MLNKPNPPQMPQHGNDPDHGKATFQQRQRLAAQLELAAAQLPSKRRKP